MPVSAATLRKLVDAGLSGDALVDVVASIDADHAMPARSSGAERQARYRERVRSASGDVTERYVTGDVTDSDADPLPPQESPQTPKETTPIPPSTPKETPLRGSKKAVRLPSDWELPLEWAAEAEAMGLPRNRIAVEAQTMRDWSLSSPDGAKRDWHAAWRNWVRRAVERLPTARGSPQFLRPERPDPFKDLSQELTDEHERESRGNGHDWHDAESLPLIAIQHHG